MKLKITFTIFAIIIIAAAVFSFGVFFPKKTVAPASLLGAADYKDATYTIEGASVKLVHGYAETEAAPGAASKLVTRYFGNEATGDLAGNGAADVAFLITRDGGGSGTFYYVVAALKTQNGYQGTNAIFLGDRIAPQTTEIKNGEIVVNYADRKPNEPMLAAPSVGISKYFRVESGVLIAAS